MICISHSKLKNNCSLEIKGHEGNQNQENLVCAAVSSHLTIFCNLLSNYCKTEKLGVDNRPGYSKLSLTLLDDNYDLSFTWNLMIQGFKLLAQQYPKIIKIN